MRKKMKLTYPNHVTKQDQKTQDSKEQLESHLTTNCIYLQYLFISLSFS